MRAAEISMKSRLYRIAYKLPSVKLVLVYRCSPTSPGSFPLLDTILTLIRHLDSSIVADIVQTSMNQCESIGYRFQVGVE